MFSIHHYNHIIMMWKAFVLSFKYNTSIIQCNISIFFHLFQFKTNRCCQVTSPVTSMLLHHKQLSCRHSYRDTLSISGCNNNAIKILVCFVFKCKYVINVIFFCALPASVVRLLCSVSSIQCSCESGLLNMLLNTVKV